MGGFQDHEIWRGPNEKWNQVGVREGDWLRLRYMADGMHTIADPRDPNIIYYNGHFGDITRLDMRNREERYIQPYPPGPIGGGAMHDEVPLQLELAGPHVADQPRRPLLRRQRALQDDRSRRARGRSSARICRPTTSRSRWRAAARSRTTTRAPSSTARSSRSPRARATPTSSGPAPTTATCRSRATAARRGPTSRRTSPARRSSRGSPPSRRPSSRCRARRTSRSISTASTTSRRTSSSPPTSARPGGRSANGLRGYVHVVKEDPKEPNLIYAGSELGIYASFDRGATLDRSAPRPAASGGRRSRRASARQRPRHRHARARLLHPRRHHAAAAASRRGATAGSGAGAVSADAGRALHPGQRHERAGQPRLGGAQSTRMAPSSITTCRRQLRRASRSTSSIEPGGPSRRSTVPAPGA